MVKKTLLTFFLFAFTATVWAIEPVYTPWYNNLAIKGYDPVAYFTENKPVKGSGSFEFDWQGATWRFASETNRNLFKSDPEKYAPQYGGYCAFAVAENNTASIDPFQFSIVNGKLYLNYSKKIQQQWLKKQRFYIEQADQYWPDILNSQ